MPTLLKEERLQFIDVLRGLAALYVLLYHFVLLSNLSLNVPSFIRPLVLNGWSGVTLFFVISAFTLSFTLEKRANEAHRTLRFYLRRFFRITPLYYAWLAIMVWRLWGLENVADHKKELLFYLGFGYNFVPNYQEGIVLASWTLGVEMVFYLLFPLLFLLVNSVSRALVLLLTTVIISRLHFMYVHSLLNPAFDINKRLYFSIFNQLPAFAIGMLAYFVTRDFGKTLDQKPLLSGGILSAAAIIFFLFPYFNMTSDVGATIPMAAVYGLLVVGLANYPILSLTNRAMIFMGAISYSLYLNHPTIVLGLAPFLAKHSGGLFHLCLCFVAVICAVTAVSCITYRFIEKPGIQLGSRLIKKFAPQPGA